MAYLSGVLHPPYGPENRGRMNGSPTKHENKTRAVLGIRGFGFRGVWNRLSLGLVVLDMSWLVFMYAVGKKKDLSRTMEVDQRGGLC